MEYDVTILEKHPSLLGGHARSDTFGGLTFCAGPQYVWDFGKDENGIGKRVLEFLDLEKKIPFDYLDRDGFERFYVGDNEGIDIPMGLDKFRKILINMFQDEEANIRKFFRYLDSLCVASRISNENGFYLEGKRIAAYSIFFSYLLSVEEKYHVYKFYDRTLEDLFNSCNLPHIIRRILFGHIGLFLEDESTLSALVYAAGTGLYHSGATFPRYGFQSLVDGLTGAIRKYNGSVYTDKNVIRLNMHKDEVAGVVCEDGSIYQSDLVISTLSPRLTCNLFEGCNSEKFDYAPSNSVIGCFVVLENCPYVVELSKKNYWWQAYPEEIDFQSPDMTKSPKFIYLVSPTANGMIHKNTDKNLQAMVIFAPGSFKQAKAAYEIGVDTHEELKSIISKKIILQVEKVFFPDLSKYIKNMEIHTPWDIYTEICAEEGSIYGRRADVGNALRKVKSIDDENNLLIACATVGQPGIGSAFQTSKILIHELTGIDI
ncbi:MAG: NAD(P)/FAD-dependent oxidoreductase [Proteobacteria bacterium]|nr:NAD(P)/FAD-dependent oxidoreductase [Pseudomonadota bacterium]